MIETVLIVTLVVVAFRLLCETSLVIQAFLSFQLLEVSENVTKFVVMLFCPKKKRRSVSFITLREASAELANMLLELVLNKSPNEKLLQAIDVAIELVEKDKGRDPKDVLYLGPKDLIYGNCAEKIIVLCWMLLCGPVWVITGAKTLPSKQKYISVEDDEDGWIGAIVEVIYMCVFHSPSIEDTIEKIKKLKKSLM